MYKLTAALLAISYAQVEVSALRGSKGIQHKQRQQQQQQQRTLQDGTVTGACTVANFASAVGGEATLATYLGTANDVAAMQQVLDTKCASALAPQT